MQIIDFGLIKDTFLEDSKKFVGGKNASLGNMIKDLNQLDINVPNGFAITTNFYYSFI